jgi:copper chaperone
MSEQISVRNVQCGSCVITIQDGLKELQGVVNIEVSIDDGTVQVTGENLDRAQLTQKLAELGYPEVTEQAG